MGFRFTLISLLVSFIFQIPDFHRDIYSIPPKFQLGNEILLSSHLDELKDKNIAVLTNQTGILPDGKHILDALIENGIKVVKIFSPEHGIRGDDSSTWLSIDPKTGIPIFSLYGDKKKPSQKDLSNVDIIIYDIQDVGARFYTYTSTLYYTIQSAVENNKQLIICDRPVMINPDYVDGFMLENKFESFVGKIPAPVCYGMTCGELANYLSQRTPSSERTPLEENSEYYSSSNIEVVKMVNYSRLMDYESLNLKWVKPSPNIFYVSSAICYPATCFLEGTNVSEGRGTGKPFEYAGAPWCDGDALAKELNSYNLNGVSFDPARFTPSGKISDYPPKFFNTECGGVFINVSDKKKFEPVKTGVAILVCLNKLFKDFKFNKDNYIDKLAGTDKLRKMILNGDDYNSIISTWQNDIENFKTEREKYLLY